MAPNKLNDAIQNLIENKIEEYIASIKAEYGSKVNETKLRELWNQVCSQTTKATKSAKAKTTKKEKDPNAPKKPLSSYMRFAKEERERIKKNKEKLMPKEIMSEIGRRWREMDDEGKKKYVEAYEEEKAEFEKETKDYEEKKEEVEEEEVEEEEETPAKKTGEKKAGNKVEEVEEEEETPAKKTGEKKAGKKEVKKPAPKKSGVKKSDSSGCVWKFVRGTKEGQNCGKSAVGGSEYCSAHKAAVEKKNSLEAKKSEKPQSKKSEGSQVKKSEKPQAKKSAKRLTRSRLVAINKLWNRETGFVFKSAREQIVIGRYNGEELVALNAEDKALCSEYGLVYEEEKKKEEVEEEEEEEVEEEED